VNTGNDCIKNSRIPVDNRWMRRRGCDRISCKIKETCHNVPQFARGLICSFNMLYFQPLLLSGERMRDPALEENRDQ